MVFIGRSIGQLEYRADEQMYFSFAEGMSRAGKRKRIDEVREWVVDIAVVSVSSLFIYACLESPVRNVIESTIQYLK